MNKRRYTNMVALLPVIEELIAKGMRHRDIWVTDISYSGGFFCCPHKPEQFKGFFRGFRYAIRK